MPKLKYSNATFWVSFQTKKGPLAVKIVDKFSDFSEVFFLQKWGFQFDQTSETQLANRHAKYIVRKEAWDVGYHVHFCRAFR